MLAAPFFCLVGLTLCAQTNNHSTQIFTPAARDKQGRFVSDVQPNQIVIKGQAEHPAH
jgi:hypothetical protein